jgi:isoleucyl-tRNA synthetase
MGGFYLDIIKDRQYTTQADSLPRRSCQTAMYHIIEAMVRWLAPILSFTADEIWASMPGERGESVFLETWYEGLFSLDTDDDFDREFWQRVIGLRVSVGQAMESFRAAGNSSLDAELSLYCDDELKSELERLENELRFVLIVSDVNLPLGR